MRRAIRNMGFGFILVYSSSAPVASVNGLSNGPVNDVGPEAGIENNLVLHTTNSTNHSLAAFGLEANTLRTVAQGYNDFTNAVFRQNSVNSSYGPPNPNSNPIDFGIVIGGDPFLAQTARTLATAGRLENNYFFEVKQPIDVARAVDVYVQGVNVSWYSAPGCPGLVPAGQGSGCNIPGWSSMASFGPTSCYPGWVHPTSKFNLSPGNGVTPPSRLVLGSVAPITTWNWENCF